MKRSEKQAMINLYKEQFSQYMVTSSDYAQLQLDGMKGMMELFFTKKEINTIENEIRIEGSQYRKDLFLVVESWLQQIEREHPSQKEYLFTWDIKGLKKVKFHYDFLLDEYKGLKGAIEILENTLQKAA